jgi:para-aminobenzoate synthetase component 1
MRIARSAFRDVTANARDVPETFQRLLHLPYPLLLDSTTQAALSDGGTTDDTTFFPNAALARYTFAMAEPEVVVEAHGLDVVVTHGSTGTVVQQRGRALDIVRSLWNDDEAADAVALEDPALPPFQGGWAGYIGYEYGGVLERIPRADISLHSSTMPDVVLARYPWVIAWDHLEQRVWIIGNTENAVQRASELLCLGSPETADGSPSVEPAVEQEVGDEREALETRFSSSLPRMPYEAAVDAIRQYIAAGDVFQVNLSQQFSATVSTEPWTLYRYLRTINPAPFSAYFDIGSATVLSVSPERFLKVSATGAIETRPIKGTRPRGATGYTDRQLRETLQSSVKDAAEHVMIVDVLRNDIARVSEFGSVQVPELMALETHPTVHHLVSTVTGQLRPEADAIDLLHASFPGGSITGAPKVRAMEIIAELEPVNRGVYCGAMGYFSRTGAMDTSIAIRTCVLARSASNNPQTWRATFSAGGGVVFDSEPDAEYEESVDKARALMRALYTVGGIVAPTSTSNIGG